MCFQIWTITPDRQNLIQTIETTRKSKISCVRLSGNCEYFAIGYENGQIDLYEKSSSLYEYRNSLNANKKTVNDLLFSPLCNNNNNPLTINPLNGKSNGNSHKTVDTMPVILVSVAEHICFWNVSYAINNPMDQSDGAIKKRRESQRFTVQHFSQDSLDSADGLIDNNGNGHCSNGGGASGSSISSSSDELSIFTNGNGNVHSSASNNNNNNSNNEKSNIWSGKYGASTKPELLSCIKFVGNSAKYVYANDSFTRFITIDDEGEIYDFNIVDINHFNAMNI